MNTEDTIAALSSATGGAIAIIRISGGKALQVAQRIWQGKCSLEKNPRKLCLGRCLSTMYEDNAMAVFMPGPKSYTGEDIVEFHCHGGNLILSGILKKILESGARQAEPGEFTFRAFMNNKMDLTQAEAVADLIGAQSSMAANLAIRQLSGKLGQKISEIRRDLLSLLAETESRLDFGDEDIEFDSGRIAEERLAKIACEIRSLLKTAAEGVILREGVRVVIAGRPNSGKSSILNRLLGYERAIVTELPGTTRDTIEEKTALGNIPVRLFDTAGIREADCIIESLGVERSINTIKIADIILWILDPNSDPSCETDFMESHLDPRMNVIAVWNKIDSVPSPENLPDTRFPTARISALTGEGLDIMLRIFEKTVWGSSCSGEPETAVAQRHAKLLESALGSMSPAIEKIVDEKWELASIHLREAVTALGKITGENADPDILDEIFSRFCIGK